LRPNLRREKEFKINGQQVIVDERYTVSELIGCGAYGFVFAAYDAQTKEEVAIKKI